MSRPIHIIGESHAGLYRMYDSIYLNGTTMHRVGRDGVRAIITEYGSRFPNPGEWLIFVVGEIDVRCHIDRQIKEKNRDEQEVISTLVDNYVRALVEYSKESGVLIGVRGIIPPLEHGNHQCQQFPIKGDYIDRLRYQKQVNALLEPKCVANKIAFIPFPKWGENPDGSLRMDMSDGIIHLDHSNANVIRACQDMCQVLQEYEAQYLS